MDGFDAGRCHNWNGCYSGLFKELALMTRSFLTKVRPLIIEFEWHAEKIGWKPDNWLFWEWRIEHDAIAKIRETDSWIWFEVNLQTQKFKQA